MRNLTTRLILIALTALYNQSSNAGLIASTSSSAGSYCYSEFTSSGGLLVVACQCGTGGCTGGNVSGLATCSKDYNHNSTCILGASGGWTYYCDYGNETACSLCQLNTGGGDTSQWTTYNSTRHVVSREIKTYDDSNYYECKLKSTTTEYGCMAGYYTTSSTGTSSMTCNKCPDNGTSEIGNLSITGCYIPSGGTFSDNTGSGTVTGNCYYKN